MDQRPICFCPVTFMYLEEDILYYECGQLGLKMLYSPEPKVLHKEKVATKAVTKSGYQRYVIRYQRVKDSVEAWMRLMDIPQE